MNVIIPAAGIGTRLLPLTRDTPKCLVEVEGRALLYYLLSDLKKLDVEKVIIVTGYKGDMIEKFLDNHPEFPSVVCIRNDRYETTNSIVSLNVSRRFWNEDFCIIDSDLLVRADLLEHLIKSKNTCLFIDNSRSPGSIDMKVKVKDGLFVYMDKNLPAEETYGEFFGLSRWTSADASDFLIEIDRLLNENRTDVWYEFAIRALAQKKKLPIKTCSSDSWFEIDTTQDYLQAGSFIEHNFK